MEFLVTQIDEIHYNGELVGYQCFDGTGQSVKVKKGQGGKLKDKWPELQVGTAYTFTMGEYNGKPYVKDFESMSEAMAEKIPAVVKEAVKMGAKVESVSPMPSGSSEMSKEDWAEKEAIKRRSIERQSALYAAKDIAVAKISKGVEMTVEKTIAVAKEFAKYLHMGE